MTRWLCRLLASQGRTFAGVVRVGRLVRFHKAALRRFIESGGAPLPGGWRREAVELHRLVDALPDEEAPGRPEWSLRVGSWRALLRVDDKARTVVILTAGPRGDVYK